MVAPPTVWEQQLTGRTRHRSGLFGKMILQVEVEHRCVTLHAPGHETRGASYTRWHDATFDDWHQLFSGVDTT
jgi:hypothetical protein